MEIKTFEAGPLSANNYLLIDNDEAVLIDCSEYKPEILKDVKLKYIILTHGHFDHVLGVNATKQATGAKVLINKLDTERMEETASIMKTFGLMGVETPQADEFINIECDNELQQLFVNVVILQILALEIALKLKRNIDNPKGLNKVVVDKFI